MFKKTIREILIIGIIGSIIVRFIEYYFQTISFAQPSLSPLYAIIFGIIFLNIISSLILDISNFKQETKFILMTPLYWLGKEIFNFYLRFIPDIQLISQNLNFKVVFIILFETLFIALPIGISVAYFWKKLKNKNA